MKRLLALVLLSACANAPPLEEEQSDIPGLLRNPTAPFASQADVTSSRLAGEWFVQQGASELVRLDSFWFETVDASFGLSACQVGGFGIDCTLSELVTAGMGRWRVISDDKGPSFVPAGELWVLWMDFDNRTAVIADPLGRFVWIIDRHETGGADRIAAAREILNWYGYDLSQLETVQ